MKKLQAVSKVVVGLSTAVVASVAIADIQQLDDVIIDGSLCVGQDCVNGESFGFDTIRVKENNLRINFQDTSASASFPSNDWRLVANDSSNGGANYFAIEDSDASRQVFRVDAGAPANALRVDSSGDVGIGEDNPVVELHVVDGDSPTLRLEQDGSSGFTPQTFDMASNESNFFVRDVTNGSQLPFRIKPGADTNTLFLDADNSIGMGTESPSTMGYGTDASLHVRRADGQASILVENASGTSALREMFELRNNGAAYINFRNTDLLDDWYVGTRDGGDFLINSDQGTGSQADAVHDGLEFLLTAEGNLTISGDLTTGGAGACAMGCDAVFNPDYNLPTIEEHARFMFENRHLEAVGPTSETGPFNITHKVGGVLNELEKAHIYIAQLNERLEKLEAELAKRTK